VLGLVIVWGVVCVVWVGVVGGGGLFGLCWHWVWSGIVCFV
jgi:hypothetical protein